MKLQYVLAAVTILGIALLLCGRRYRPLRIAGGVLLILLGGFLAGYFTYRPYTSYAWRRHFARLEARFLNKPSPDVSTTTLTGKRWRLHEERGRVIVLEFWASWCGPCERVLPALKSLQATYGSRDDFRIVGIALDEDCEAAASAARDKEMTWMQTCEGEVFENSIARAFGVNSLPSLWLVDRDGRVQGVRVGEKTLEDRVGKLLAGSEEPSPAVGQSRGPSNNRLNPSVGPARGLAGALCGQGQES